MALKYNGVNLPAGFNPQTNSPFDVRTVVSTVADRDLLPKTYPGMMVTVLGSPNGLNEYPDMKVWRLKKDILTGLLPTPADWTDMTTAVATSGSYKGTFAIDQTGAYTPALNTTAIRSALLTGDYYIAQVSGGATATLNPAFDGITTIQTNDTLWYDGTKFNKYQNTNPTLVIPLYTSTQNALFTADVINLIRTEGIKQWTAKPYVVGEVVFNRYQVGGTGLYFIDTWYTNTAMGQAGSALPTANTNNTSWWLLGSTNPAQFAGLLKINDAAGKPATLTPLTVTLNATLSPEQIDARIAEYGGGSGTRNAILGGNAATFPGPGINDLPAN